VDRKQPQSRRGWSLRQEVGGKKCLHVKYYAATLACEIWSGFEIGHVPSNHAALLDARWRDGTSTQRCVEIARGIGDDVERFDDAVGMRPEMQDAQPDHEFAIDDRAG
jgi:hypothetical protein